MTYHVYIKALFLDMYNSSKYNAVSVNIIIVCWNSEGKESNEQSNCRIKS